MQGYFVMELKYVNLSHTESRIIQQLLNIVGDGIQNYHYKQLFDSFEKKISRANRTWYIYTINSYYDAAVRDWCMVFGSYSEPTHYIRLLKHRPILNIINNIIDKEKTSKEDILAYLLRDISITQAVYEKYHQNITDYRNRYLVHREHRPEKINDNDLSYPELEILFRSLSSLYLFIVKIIKQLPDSHNGQYQVKYYDFENKVQINEYLEKTNPCLNLNI